MISFALTSSALALDVATKLIKADVRLHNLDAIRDDMAIIFVVNHFTRLETLLVPYLLHKHMGKVIWSLAAAELFEGRIGDYLRSIGAISTRDPDRDKTIVRELLLGEHPWLIFPEGAMIKDKKVVNHRGEFRVYDKGQRRPPHRGAAVLALVSEFYRHKLACLQQRADEALLGAALERFGIQSLDGVLDKRTVIVPVNITYFPIRSHDNVVLRLARALAKDLSPRAIEELSVEGTVLSEDTDIDIVLGAPIDVRAYLNEPQYAQLVQCGIDNMGILEQDPKSLFNDAARRLMLRYMEDIYYLTTVNSDHLLAGLLRAQRAGRFTERMLRERLYLCARGLDQLNYRPLHRGLTQTAQRVLSEEPCPPFGNFLSLAISEGLVEREDGEYFRRVPPTHEEHDFNVVRQKEMTYVIANEIEPIPVVTSLVRSVSRLSRKRLPKTVADVLLQEDRELFEEDYQTYYEEEFSRGCEVGRPFLLMPRRVNAGIVLSHGYMAAPVEVRALAEYLLHRGYAVYGVRLQGHGTSPEDLAQTTWEEWYESFNRGYALLRSLTDQVILGGFSTGGALALLAAANKRAHARAVFAINAPLHLRNNMVRFVPSLVRVNTFLKRIRLGKTEWEYVENKPENPFINYSRNPLHGVEQLQLLTQTMGERLHHIPIPTLIIQGSQDPVVAPESGQDIFSRIGTPHKQLLLLERDRHGIVNGDGVEEVFDAVHRFLLWARGKAPTLLGDNETPANISAGNPGPPSESAG
jgi:esterase/lipase/1-acyl-sn-glycerol-3-phosphate acyltransferase